MKNNWHKNFKDVVFEAHFRAAIVGKRYQVKFEPNNKWWYLRETHIPIKVANGDT